jgi:hypothetical protein
LLRRLGALSQIVLQNLFLVGSRAPDLIFERTKKFPPKTEAPKSKVGPFGRSHERRPDVTVKGYFFSKTDPYGGGSPSASSSWWVIGDMDGHADRKGEPSALEGFMVRKLYMPLTGCAAFVCACFASPSLHWQLRRRGLAMNCRFPPDTTHVKAAITKLVF